MKAMRIAVFVAVALAQITVPASMIWKREQTLKRGRVWKFKTAPVDPVDAIRGRYIALRFAAEELPKSVSLPKQANAPLDNSVYATLKEDAEGFAQVDHVSDIPSTGDNVIKTEAWQVTKAYLRFPFDQFWVNEKIAPEAETAYAANSRRQKDNAYVTVRVRNGDAALEQLYIDNQPLADYLRAQSSPR